jgi:hypothetical protein
MAGLAKYLSEEAVVKLEEIEHNFSNNIEIAPILQAPNEDDLKTALNRGYGVAIEYYVEAGIIIWRALEHDYLKLLSLTETSTELIEKTFFIHVKRLDPDVFTMVVAALRVLREVGNRITREQEKAPPEDQAPPMKYLVQVIFSTLLLSCFLAYLHGDVKKARRDNLKILADELFSGVVEVFHEAQERNLFRNEADESFWNPNWQKGEVEADLDKQLGRVTTYDSVEDLLRALNDESR